MPVINVGVPSVGKFGTAIDVSSHRTVRITIRRLFSVNRQHVTCTCRASGSGGRGVIFDTRTHLRKLVRATRGQGVAIRHVTVHGCRSTAGAVLGSLLAVSPTPATLCYRDSRLTLPIVCGLYRCKRTIPRRLSIVKFSSMPLTTGVNLAALRRSPFGVNRGTTHGVLDIVSKGAPGPLRRALRTRLVVRRAATFVS